MIPTLPRQDTDPERRATQLASARAELSYAWDRPAGVATAVSVPKRLGYSVGVIAQVTQARVVLAANKAALRLTQRDASEVSTFASCRALFATLRVPAVADLLESDRADAAFAWQRVAGANPHMLRRIDSPPDAFRGVDVPDGPLFLGDWRMLDDIPAGSWQGAAKSLWAPLALFTSTATGLMPVAIALEGQVSTPEHGLRWELARAKVQIADATVQENFWHLGRAHFLLEAFALATERQLAANHPLFVLLSPHFEGTVAINGAAREELVVPGGQVDQLLAPSLEGSMTLVRRALETFRLEDVLLPAALQDRGVHDTDALPDYPYRDDGLLIFAAIRRFVDAYLHLYYAADAEVIGDVELAAWVAEVRSPDGGRLAGFAPIASIAALVDAVTGVIFAASAGHAALNYSQADFMAYTPNMPAAGYAASPADWSALLPSRSQAEAQLEFMVQQSGVRHNELGRYPRHHFADRRVDEPLARFQQELDAAEVAIGAREPARLLPYPYLLPSNLTASIHI